MIIQLLVDQWVPGTGLVLSTVNCLFIAHHLATTFYMTSARWLGSGHMSAMSLMLLGEVTAPIMNLRRLANAAVRLEEAASFAKQQQNLGWLVSLRPIINVVYAFLYIFFRAVAGPLCAVHLVYDLLCTRNGRKNVPMHVSIFWVALCGGVLVGSIPWIKETWQIVTGTLGTA